LSQEKLETGTEKQVLRHEKLQRIDKLNFWPQNVNDKTTLIFCLEKKQNFLSIQNFCLKPPSFLPLKKPHIQPFHFLSSINHSKPKKHQVIALKNFNSNTLHNQQKTTEIKCGSFKKNSSLRCLHFPSSLCQFNSQMFTLVVKFD
jgi:hypothetical protein